MDLSIPYYEDMTRISNSNIGWFIKKGPRYLHEMLNNEREGLKLPQLEKGTMIHEYILQPDEFWNDYIILDFEIPKVKQQKDLIEEYFRLTQLDPLSDQDSIKLKAYKSAYSNKKTDAKCLEEANSLIDTYKEYIEYLSKKDTKKIISFADLNMLKEIKKNLEEHKKANELLFNFPKTFETHNEFHINWNFPKIYTGSEEISCKSLIDRVMIDHENKKVILIDLKTTADVYNFKHSVEEFDYLRQLAYYWFALYWYFKNELHLDLEEYEKETYIIAIQSHDTYEIRVFKFSAEQTESRIDTIVDTLKDIAWHIENNLWEHTKDYYLGNGDEKLQ